MRHVVAIMVVCLLLRAAPAQAAEKQEPIDEAGISVEDLKVVQVLETLQLMELSEDMGMLKDMDYLIEDDQNATQN